ncbi:MAG: RagB/SusD family nutrient uptake outer membrane protein [Gemmatimonadales bacterium]
MRHASIFRRGACAALLALTSLAAAGCGGLFDIENPGEILDDDLNDPDLIPVILTGLSSDFSDIVDQLALDVGRSSDEMAGTGSYTATGLFRRGILDPDEVEYEWEQAHEARWMAEIHLERIRNLIPDTFDGSRHVARAYLFMGHANRILGDNYCEVSYDGGPLVPRDSAFRRAITAFNDVLAHADTSPDLATAAHGGLAQAYLGLGDWAQATQHAAMVATDFEFVALYDDNDDDNQVWVETHGRPEMSAFMTLAGSYDPPEVRAPYTACGVYDANGNVVSTGAGCPAQGADGQNPHWRQEKYSSVNDDIPVVKGAEMRLIEAEAALRAGDLTTFTGRINDVLTFYGLGPISEPASAGALEYPNAYDDAWSILDRERHLTLWVEGRRQWDLERWDHPFLQGGGIIYTGEAQRDRCRPIPTSECVVNENIPCS